GKRLDDTSSTDGGTGPCTVLRRPRSFEKCAFGTCSGTGGVLSGGHIVVHLRILPGFHRRQLDYRGILSRPVRLYCPTGINEPRTVRNHFGTSEEHTSEL